MPITKRWLVLKKYGFTILFISWMVFVTFSSLSSFESIDPPRFDIPHLDKAVHFTFYFMGCLLGIFFLRERTHGKMSMKKAIFSMVFATIMYGVAIELLQHYFTVIRTGDVLDGLANTIGSICGAFAIKYYFSSRRETSWEF